VLLLRLLLLLLLLVELGGDWSLDCSNATPGRKTAAVQVTVSAQHPPRYAAWVLLWAISV